MLKAGFEAWVEEHPSVQFRDMFQTQFAGASMRIEELLKSGSLVLGDSPDGVLEEALRLLRTEAVTLKGEPAAPIRYRRPGR